MNSILQYDNKHIAEIFESVKKLCVDYLNELNDRNVSLINPSFNLPNIPAKGLGAAQTQMLFEKEFLSNILATSGKRYWGFVTGGSTPAAIAGDWLTSVFDQNTQSTKGNGDVSAALEIHTTKLLLELFNLPDNFTGAFVSGATMSNFTALAVARQWYGETIWKRFCARRN